MGDDLTYDNLEITFLVDEKLGKLYRVTQLVSWYWFPKSRTQFTNFRTEKTTLMHSQQTLENWFCDIAWNCKVCKECMVMQHLQSCHLKTIHL